MTPTRFNNTAPSQLQGCLQEQCPWLYTATMEAPNTQFNQWRSPDHPSAAREIGYHKITAIRWNNCTCVPPTLGDKQWTFSLIYFSEFLLKVYFLWHFVFGDFVLTSFFFKPAVVHNDIPKIINKLYTPTPRQFKHHNVSLSPSQFVLILSLLLRFSFPEECSMYLPTKQVNTHTDSKNQKTHPSQNIHADFLYLFNIAFFEQGNFVR